jgi:hypothetical protein
MYSDVTFGLNMLEKGIEICHNEKFLSQHLNFYNILLENANQYITFHYVKKTEEFNYFNQLCNVN